MSIIRRSGLAMAWLGLLAVLVGCAGGGTTAVIRIPEISFMHQDPDEALQIMNLDGTNVRTVLTRAATGITFEETSLAPDGQHVAFTGFAPGLGGGIYIVKADGTGITRLADGGNPSFNGSKISFRDIANFSDETLYIMNADGSNKVAVATLPDDGLQFERTSLSPDGSTIVFDGFPVGPDPAGVYRISVDGTGLTRLADGKNSSSNGSKIAFVFYDGTEETLFLMNMDGSGAQVVITRAGSGLLLNETSISPDGTKIVFHGAPNAGGGSGIYIVNTDGTGLTQLVGGRNPSIR